MRKGVITLIHLFRLKSMNEEEEGQSLLGMGYRYDKP